MRAYNLGMIFVILSFIVNVQSVYTTRVIGSNKSFSKI